MTEYQGTGPEQPEPYWFTLSEAKAVIRRYRSIFWRGFFFYMGLVYMYELYIRGLPALKKTVRRNTQIRPD